MFWLLSKQQSAVTSKFVAAIFHADMLKDHSPVIISWIRLYSYLFLALSSFNFAASFVAGKFVNDLYQNDATNRCSRSRLLLDMQQHHRTSNLSTSGPISCFTSLLELRPLCITLISRSSSLLSCCWG